MMYWPRAFYLVAVVFAAVSACSDFETRTVSYTSKEAVLSTQTVVIVEGEAKCRGKGVTSISQTLVCSFFTVFPAVRRTKWNFTAGIISCRVPRCFQVTYVFEDKEFPKGSYEVRFFNDEGASILRRSAKGASVDGSAKPVFTVPIRHKGVSKTPWVYPETVALGAISIITLAAFLTKSRSF
ncbi:unnamed protein product [Calicophoron daubneyi]|uniref:Translocon-associated protein subunit delta n=1 Tax=Calicophoron daubneyi TaxID=300641 RepID=A0AAV2TNT7_CALDB